MGSSLVRRSLSLALLVLFPIQARAHSSYREVDLVSNLPGRAERMDPALANPWGLVLLPNGVFRVADNHTGVSTAYGPHGASVGVKITIPPMGDGSPTGMVLNSFLRAFKIPKTGRAARLLFVSEDGSISTWNPNVDRDDAIRVLTVDGAIYKGVALGKTDNGPMLFAADFHDGRIDVFDDQFRAVRWKGPFNDPDLPDGYAPFNIQNIGGKLVVTYAKQNDERVDDVSGPGFGFVNVFDTRGRLLRRFASGGSLNAPWGLAIAPKGFGRFGGALLVGNFGDGRISAFNLRTGAFLGRLAGRQGEPIEIEGLWALEFGSGRRDRDGDEDEENGDHGDRRDHGDHGDRGGRAQALYFTAGINDETDGLFGFIEAIGGSHDHDDENLLAGSVDGMTGMAVPELEVRTMGSNPVRLSDQTGIRFSITLARPGAVDLGIFDVAGRLVAEPVRGPLLTGTTVVRWDGTGMHGEQVRAGAYFYRAMAGSHVSRGRIVVIP